jgi:hypothetical protein
VREHTERLRWPWPIAALVVGTVLAVAGTASQQPAGSAPPPAARAPLADASGQTVDGSALVLHAGADDDPSDPAGHADGRVACGVVEP